MGVKHGSLPNVDTFQALEIEAMKSLTSYCRIKDVLINNKDIL